MPKRNRVNLRGGGLSYGPTGDVSSNMETMAMWRPTDRKPLMKQASAVIKPVLVVESCNVPLQLVGNFWIRAS